MIGSELALRQALSALVWGDVPFDCAILAVRPNHGIVFALAQDATLQPFLLKPNAAEASELTGLPISSVEQAMAAAARMLGIAQIVISMGASGALLVDAGRGWLATPPAIQQHNPIGAGDSLVAGLA